MPAVPSQRAATRRRSLTLAKTRPIRGHSRPGVPSLNRPVAHRLDAPWPTPCPDPRRNGAGALPPSGHPIAGARMPFRQSLPPRLARARSGRNGDDSRQPAPVDHRADPAPRSFAMTARRTIRPRCPPPATGAKDGAVDRQQPPARFQAKLSHTRPPDRHGPGPCRPNHNVRARAKPPREPGPSRSHPAGHPPSPRHGEPPKDPTGSASSGIPTPPAPHRTTPPR